MKISANLKKKIKKTRKRSWYVNGAKNTYLGPHTWNVTTAKAVFTLPVIKTIFHVQTCGTKSMV